MYLPNYSFAPDDNREIQRTQSALHTSAYNGRFGMAVTILAAVTDATLINSLLQGSNFTPEAAFFSAVMMVLGLDAGMFLLAQRLNHAQLERNGFRNPLLIAVCCLTLISFGFAYSIYYRLASSTNTVSLLLPVITSIASFIVSIDYNSRRTKSQKLQDLRATLQQDIASAQDYIALYDRTENEFNSFAYDHQQLKVAIKSLQASATEAELLARTSLADELGSEEAANTLLAAAELNNSVFWEQLEKQAEDLVAAKPAFLKTGTPSADKARINYTLPWAAEA